MDELINVDNKLALGKFYFDKTGLSVTGDPTFEEWQNCGEFLKQAEKSVLFWIGDWLNYGEKKYGETYSQALEITDYEEGTLRDAKWVSSKVELSRRRDNLSFSHHREVAQLPPEEQDFWLDKAEEQNLTRNELRRAIKTVKTLNDNSINTEAKIILHQGDMVDILPTISGIDLLIADPPYNVTDWDWDKIGSSFIDVSSNWIDASLKTLSPEYNLFWFCSPMYASDIERLFYSKGVPIQSRIVWHRRNMAMGSDSKYKFIDSWEMIFHCGNKPLNFSTDWGDDRFDVQTFAVPQTNFTDMKIHPTQKPLDLIKWVVDHGSFDSDTVLDPFAGSGTTGHACAELNRNCILVEKDTEYCNLIRQRLHIE